MGLIVLGVYILLALMLFISAVRNRREGWISGALFAVFMLAFPLVIGAMYGIFRLVTR